MERDQLVEDGWINLDLLFKVVWKGRWTIVVCTLLGLIAGGFVQWQDSKITTTRYSSLVEISVPEAMIITDVGQQSWARFVREATAGNNLDGLAGSTIATLQSSVDGALPASKVAILVDSDNREGAAKYVGLIGRLWTSYGKMLEDGATTRIDAIRKFANGMHQEPAVNVPGELLESRFLANQIVTGGYRLETSIGNRSEGKTSRFKSVLIGLALGAVLGLLLVMFRAYRRSST